MDIYKKLFRLSRQELPLLLSGLFFLALSSAALLAYPYFIKKIIDEAIVNKNFTQLNTAALLALVVFVIQAITSALRYYFFTLAGERTVKRLRARLFGKIIGQDISFFDQQKTGELLGRLSSDTALLQSALSVNISMLIRALVQAIGATTMLFMTSAKLTFFILIIIPPLGFLAARFGKKVKIISKSSQDALAASSGVAEEGMAAIRTVKSFSQENFENQRYQDRLEASFALSKEKINVVSKFSALVSTVGFTSIVFVVWFGGKLVIENEMSVGTLTSYLLYVVTAAFSVGMLGSLWTDFMSAFGASERIFDLMENKTEELNTGLAHLQQGQVEFRDVHFSYPARPHFPVLQGVSFSIAPHETVAVVGQSGAGKSTLAQLMMRFYETNSGSIFFDGIDSTAYSLQTVREAIGLVAQEPVLVSESLYENIRYGKPDATNEEVVQASTKAFAHEFISGFPEGYHTLVGERGVQLSGGQKQRVAIARALLKNPRILVLDEATSALDAQSEHLVQKALDEQIGKRATLIIAHRLSTVKRADKIIVMEAGRVVQVGKHQELFNDQTGLYHKLVQRQFESSKENS